MPRQPARASSGRYVSRLTGGTLAIIMAGGRGERLRDLTAQRCKPATAFGGKFRILDFVLSNCVKSGKGAGSLQRCPVRAPTRSPRSGERTTARPSREER